MRRIYAPRECRRTWGWLVSAGPSLWLHAVRAATVHRVDAPELFSAELARRGLRHAAGPLPGQVDIWTGGMRLEVSVENLARRLSGGENDALLVAQFTDHVITAARPAALTTQGLYWFLEPSDYQVSAGYRAAVSPQLDRVLVHVSTDGALISWVTGPALSELGLSAEVAAQRAWSNLDTALHRAQQVIIPAPGDVTVLSFASDLPSKASLLLAPSLRAAISSITGWPVLAIAPDRDFTCIWDAAHPHLTGRLAGIVTREHARAPYPLSAEVFQISDSIKAIGRYQRHTGTRPASQ